MDELRFNPCGVIALFVENSAHCVAEAVACYSPRIPDTFENLVNAGFAHGFTRIITPSEHIGIAACHFPDTRDYGLRL